MLSDKIKFFKSIKFRLALIYSLILFLFGGTFVLGINIYINDILHKNPPQHYRVFKNRAFLDLDFLEQERIRQIRQDDLSNIKRASLLGLFPLAGLSFILGYIIAYKSLEPLSLLQKKINSLQESSLGTQADIISEDEIGSIAKSFNEMSIRLKESFDIQSQFVEDASHELRTPLTIMHTNFDTILMDTTVSKQDLIDNISVSLKQVKELTLLTDNLLTLSGTSSNCNEKIDLRNLIQKEINKFDDIVKEKSIDFIWQWPEKPFIKELDIISFGRVIYNLIDNAIKYSDNNQNKSQIEIKLFDKIDIFSRDKKIIIQIIDNGIGIPKEYQDKIFDRFFRIEESRNKSVSGFGLGLPIVKKIVEDNKGRIRYFRKDNQTVFEIII